MIGNESGNEGEKAAREYLEAKGYSIVKTNYTSRYGEIDIIAEKDETIVFIEVKKRKEGSLVGGAEAVNYSKRKKIFLTSLVFLETYEKDLQPRYDVIEITAEKEGGISVRHIKSAFDTEEFF